MDSDFGGRPAKKYHGLMNQGATCYLNSVLQVLFMTEDFRERVKRNNAGKEHIDKELRDLFNDLEKYDGYTYNITSKLKIKNVCEQRDAAEHYEKILRLTSPEASQIFHGELINRNTCKKCEIMTKSEAGFWHLPLPLVNNSNEYSVEKGIEDFFCPSEINGDNQMYCEGCDEKRDAVLDCVVKHHPEVLVLLLKRFEFDYRYMMYVKINQPVNVASTIQISGKSYKLYAIVEHFGELRYGHYISTIRSQDDGKWYIFNDSKVAPHSASPTLERSQSAYLLFYRKQKETSPVNTTRYTEDINITTKEDQVPEKSKPENADAPVRGTLKRARSFDLTKQGDEVKKPQKKPCVEEHGLDQRNQKCEDLDIGSSSSSHQMCDFYVAGLNEERKNSKCNVDNNNMDTEFSDHKQQHLKEFNALVKSEQSETRQQLMSGKTDHFSQICQNQEKRDRAAQSETEIYCTGDTMKVNSETKVKTEEGKRDGSEERSVDEFNHGLNKRYEHTCVNTQRNVTEVPKEACFIKSHFEQPVQDQGGLCETSENCCKDYGECSTVRRSCPDLDTKTAMSRKNKIMTETKEAQLIQRCCGQVENQESAIKHLVQFCEDNEKCEGLQPCPDVYMTAEKQAQRSDQAQTIFRKNERITDTSIKDYCDNSFQDISGDGSSLGQQTHSKDEQNNAKNEIVDKIDNGTKDTKASELSMGNISSGLVDVKTEGEDKSNKSCLLLRESSCKNDPEKVEQGCKDYGISDRTHSSEVDVPMQTCHSRESLISMESDKKKACSDWEDVEGGNVVQSYNVDTTVAYEETDPGSSAFVNQNDSGQSISTVQNAEAEVQGKNIDQEINLEKLGITEKPDFCVESQAGSNTDGHVKSMEKAKVERPRLTIYNHYLESLEKYLYFNKSQSDGCNIEKHNIVSVVQPEPVATTLPTEYFRSQENVVDTSCNTHTLERSENAVNVQEQVTIAGMEVERVVVTREDDVETIKITPKKRQNERKVLFS